MLPFKLWHRCLVVGLRYNSNRRRLQNCGNARVSKPASEQPSISETSSQRPSTSPLNAYFVCPHHRSPSVLRAAHQVGLYLVERGVVPCFVPALLRWTRLHRMHCSDNFNQLPHGNLGLRWIGRWKGVAIWFEHQSTPTHATNQCRGVAWVTNDHMPRLDVRFLVL